MSHGYTEMQAKAKQLKIYKEDIPMPKGVTIRKDQINGSIAMTVDKMNIREGPDGLMWFELYSNRTRIPIVIEGPKASINAMMAILSFYTDPKGAEFTAMMGAAAIELRELQAEAAKSCTCDGGGSLCSACIAEKKLQTILDRGQNQGKEYAKL